MGTRADFYVGRGKDAEWLGSIAWDGYPGGIFDADGIAPPLPSMEKEWRERVTEFVTKRDDGTLPAMGWPWPWEDSNTTDYAYAFDGGKVYGCGFGAGWFLLNLEADCYGKASEDEEEESAAPVALETAVFPHMGKASSAPAGSARSGIMRGVPAVPQSVSTDMERPRGSQTRLLPLLRL